MYSKYAAFLIALFFSITCSAQSNIIPKPAMVKAAKGTTLLTNRFVIECDFDSIGHKTNALYLQKELLKSNVSCTVKDSKSNSRKLNSIQLINRGKGNNEYTLMVQQGNITIDGAASSVFYGIQTLLQLIKDAPQNSTKVFSLPNLTIVDSPRFEYRGMHLDVTRHFFPVPVVKKYLDYLASYKFNKFHWHLTDDQGWRIPIQKYPLLTTVGAERNGTLIGRYPGKGSDNTPYSGAYSIAEIKEVIQYAAERHIEVIPEIELPGHASAAIAAYSWLSCFPDKLTPMPNNMMSKKSIEQQQAGRIKLVQETWGVFDDIFCAGKPTTITFLKDVLSEVIDLFPSKYIHIGGDEAPKTHWKICPQCQQRMKDNNLKDEHELQSWLINEMGNFLTSKGKALIGWDEILEGGLAENAIVMSWRGEAGGIEAAKQQHQVIMTPGKPLYFDHTQSASEDSVTFGGLNTLEAVYNYNPIPASLPTSAASYILGAQANVWAEYISNPAKIEYQIFPRIAALSEVLWTQPALKNWNTFEKKLPRLFANLKNENINFSKAYFDVSATVLPATDNEKLLLGLSTKLPNAVIKYQLEEGAFLNYKEPILVYKSLDVTYSIFDKELPLRLRTKSFKFNKATGKRVNLKQQPSPSYPGNGSITLVDGIQNTKGLPASSEFLGFKGTDLDVTIDLGKEMDISEVIVHTLKQETSWIYLPREVEVTYLPYIDTNVVTKQPPKETVTVPVDRNLTEPNIKVVGNHTCRYVRVVAKNYGTIEAGNAGAGNPAWLFIDEIEIK